MMRDLAGRVPGIVFDTQLEDVVPVAEGRTQETRG